MRSVVLAIDPGSEQSAWLVYNAETGGVRSFAKVPNADLLNALRVGVSSDVAAVVIEWVKPRGMLASEQLFETLWWAGRFGEAASRWIPVERLERAEVKRHLLGAPKGTDAQVRAALIDRFGGIGGKEAAIGRKATPGPLYGIATDVWAALAVAVSWTDGIR